MIMDWKILILGLLGIGWFLVGFWRLTGKWELQKKRFSLLFTLGVVVAFSIVWFATEDLVVLVFLCLLLRPILMVFALVWSEVFTSLAADAVINVLEGGGGEAEVLSPAFAFARHLRGTGRSEEALVHLEEKLKGNENDFECLYLMAVVLAEDLGQFERAEKIMRRILESKFISVQQKELAWQRYEGWYQRKDPGGISPLEGLWEKVSKREKLGADRAWELWGSGRSELAMEVLQKTIRKNPEDQEAKILLGRLHAERGELEEGRKVLESLLQMKYLRGGYRELCQGLMKDWEQGIVKIRKNEPNEEPEVELEEGTAIEKARKRVAEGRYGSAIAILEEHLKEQPGDFEGWELIANIYAQKCQDTRGAERILQRVKKEPAISAEKKVQLEALVRGWKADLVR